MSKRFIDSGIFDDDWFMDLTKDAKLLWVYFITKCDHAGILKLNVKLCKVQTGITDIQSVIEQLGNRLVSVSEHLYFIPKYIEYQYPGFPNSRVRQQQSAVEILTKHGLFNNNKLTLTEVLPNTYVNVNVNDNVNVKEEAKIDFLEFWNLYNKKVGSKDNCEKKWNKLEKEEQLKIIEILPSYINQFTDKQFQPFPETFLNQKRWDNEIILPTAKNTMNEILTYDEILKLSEKNPDIWKQYTTIKRDGERKAVFQLKKERHEDKI